MRRKKLNVQFVNREEGKLEKRELIIHVLPIKTAGIVVKLAI
jgi:hypothetical protein